MPHVKESYVRPEQKSVINKSQVILDGIRFVKRITNVYALPGKDQFDLGGKIMSGIIGLRFFRKMISCLDYGLKNGENAIINEAIQAIYNILEHGRMALR